MVLILVLTLLIFSGNSWFSSDVDFGLTLICWWLAIMMVAYQRRDY